MSLILVIGDERRMRSLVQRILEKEGHSVASTADADRGLATFRAVKPDLVITDIIMPEKEGIWTIPQIRQADAAARILAMLGGRQHHQGRRSRHRPASSAPTARSPSRSTPGSSSRR
jgi:CheY-like chemotaxis protein